MASQLPKSAQELASVAVVTRCACCGGAEVATAAALFIKPNLSLWLSQFCLSFLFFGLLFFPSLHPLPFPDVPTPC